MTVLGIAASAGQIALQLLATKRKRGFDNGAGTFLIPDATIEEVHSDDMEITDHPVEQGTTISDHAFKLPASVVITAGWSDSPNNAGVANTLLGVAATANSAVRAVIGAAELVDGVLNVLDGSASLSPSSQTYQSLVAAQENRSLFTIYTGKRTYQNMLIKSITTTTDQRTENSAIIRITCRQLLMAVTQTVTVPDSSVMANPEQNGAAANMGTTYPVPAPNINVSALPS